MAFTEIFDLVDRFLEITLAFFTRVRKLLGFGKIGVWRNNNEISCHKGVIYFNNELKCELDHLLRTFKYTFQVALSGLVLSEA